MAECTFYTRTVSQLELTILRCGSGEKIAEWKRFSSGIRDERKEIATGRTVFFQPLSGWIFQSRNDRHSETSSIGADGRAGAGKFRKAKFQTSRSGHR